jgi:hypothetical protein
VYWLVRQSQQQRWLRPPQSSQVGPPAQVVYSCVQTLKPGPVWQHGWPMPPQVPPPHEPLTQVVLPHESPFFWQVPSTQQPPSLQALPSQQSWPS